MGGESVPEVSRDRISRMRRCETVGYDEYLKESSIGHGFPLELEIVTAFPASDSTRGRCSLSGGLVSGTMIPEEAGEAPGGWPELRSESVKRNKVQWGEGVRSEEEAYLGKLGESR